MTRSIGDRGHLAAHDLIDEQLPLKLATADADAHVAGLIVDPETEVGTVLSATIGAAQVQAGVQGGPQFVKRNTPVMSATAMGVESVYYPSVLRIDKTLPNFGAKYVALFSTDHSTGDGGIYLAESDDLLSWSLTTKKTGGVVWVDAASGPQTETPSVWWNAEEGLFFMLYQNYGTGTPKVAGQITLLATSPDLINWTGQGIAIDTYANIDFISAEGHTGYARVTQVGNALIAHHLLTGGIYFRRACSYSNDGRTWRVDPIHQEQSPQFASSRDRGLILHEIFRWRDAWYGLGEDRNITGGFDRWPVIGRVRPDLKYFSEPTYRPFPIDQPWEAGFFKSGHIFADEGKLYLFYQYGTDVGVAIAEGA